MRYIAKVHVLDVLDQVVISGYVYDADPITDPDHEPLEFTYQVPGTGLSEPLPWLLNSLYRALVAEQRPPHGGTEAGVPMGGSHTISGSSDRSEEVMG
jgi:hypothetical protein